MNETDWSRFAVHRIGMATFIKRNLIHTDLLMAAARRARGGILEVGIGSGAQSALLSRLHPTLTLDNDWRILSAARPNLDRFGPDARLVSADGFVLPFRDQSMGVSISQGLFEHFQDEEIAALLREALRVCRSVVFSVPSDRYPRQDVGNERLMSPAQWERIVTGALGEGFRVVSRYYRFDPERLKYSLAAKKDLGGFNVLVTIDRR